MSEVEEKVDKDLAERVQRLLNSGHIRVRFENGDDDGRAEIKRLEAKLKDDFRSPWDERTLAATMTKLIESYWPTALVLAGTMLVIKVIQWFSMFWNFGGDEIAMSWWIILPLGIGYLVHATWLHDHTENRFRRRVEQHKQLASLRSSQLGNQACDIREYHEQWLAARIVEREAEQRCIADLKWSIAAALQSPEGTVAFRPIDQGLALQAVNALLAGEVFPEVIATVSRAEYEEYRHWYRDINREVVRQMEKDLKWYQENHPKVGELLRALVQKLWESRTEPNPLAAEVRQRLVRTLFDFWGKRSYPFNFVRDLGAAHELVKELGLDKEGDKK